MKAAPGPFVGRRPAVEGLRSSLASAGVAVITGDAGIGKTRLLHETLAEAVTAGEIAEVIWCQGDELDRERPFGALHVLLEWLHVASDAGTGVKGSLHRIDRILDELARVNAAGPDRVPGVGAAGNAPTVIVVDDAQWLDPMSWRVVRLLARSVREALDEGLDGLCLIVVARSPMSATMRGVLDDAIPADVDRLVLVGLDAEAVTELTAAHGRPGDEAAVLLARTGGNPLLLEELLRVKSLEPTVPTSQPDSTATTTPASLRASVLSRLVGLDQRHHALLRYAALLGTRFALTDLAHVTAKSVVEVIDTLSAAIETGVIVADGTELRFRHDLVAECFRDDQPDALRQACHRHIAETLAARGGAPTRIAEHYVLAAESVDDELSRRDAAHWLERAANDVRLQSLPSAIGLLERSIGLSGDGTDRQRRRVDLATMLLLAGRLEAAEEVGRSELRPDARADAERGVDPGDSDAVLEHALRVHGVLAVIASLRGPMHATEAHRHYGVVLDAVHWLLERGTVSSTRCAELQGIHAETLAGRSIVTVYTGDVDGAASLADRALVEAERCASRAGISRAHETLALVAMARSDSERARQHAERSVAWFSPDNGPWAMVVTPHLTASLVAVSAGDLDRAVDVCLDGLRVTETSDHLLPRLYLLPCLAIFRLIQGDLDEAVRLAHLTNELIDDWCPTHPTPVTRALVGYVASLRGDGGAVGLVDTAAVQLGASGAQLAIADLAAWMVAMVWEGAGRTDDAVGLLRLIWELIGAATGALVMAPDLVRMQRDSDRAFADHVVATLDDRAARSPGDRTDLVRRRARAILNDDVAELVAVADRYDELSSPLTGAWSRFDAASAAQRTGTATAEFEVILRAAIHSFDRLNAPTVTARLRALGRTGGVALRPARKARTDVLTDTERRVAELASQGRSNREIGDALYMSGRTAEAHLGRVFAKLGIKNRVELAARLVR